MTHYHFSESEIIFVCATIFVFVLSAWIESANMKPYFQYKSRLMNANKTSTFKEAVECIEKYIGENNIEVSEMKSEGFIIKIQQECSRICLGQLNCKA